jgi:hypothetical protein
VSGTCTIRGKGDILLHFIAAHPQRKGPLRRSKRGSEDDINMDLKAVGLRMWTGFTGLMSVTSTWYSVKNGLLSCQVERQLAS